MRKRNGTAFRVRLSTDRYDSINAKNVTVLGLGRSGQATVKFLAARGVRVFASDQGALRAELKAELLSLGVILEENGHSERALHQADLIVVSPGIESAAAIMKVAREREIPILGELELAYQFCPSEKIIAITGTNGKTTTTRVMGELLNAQGHEVVVAGNIGTPVIEHLEKIHAKTVVVLEVSSFQLETIVTFKPHISLFLNFAPNHLDRYRNLVDYFDAKCRIFENQTEKDFAVVSRQLPLLPTSKPTMLCYEKVLPQLRTLTLSEHNRLNLAAALTASRVIDPQISPKKLDLQRAFAIPHRIQFVGEVHKVRFYDDSKATNVAATLAALETFDAPLIPILGGHDKGCDYSPLAQAIVKKDVKHVLLIGEASEKIARALQHVGYHQPLSVVRDLREAVACATHHPGSVCLLSPACSSFDMFKNYEERGEVFRQAVLEISRRVPARST
ncbi:UDP-N-acetylmuramoyl-L-alanine--D-glutamate ligase [Candidatus Acetothermia bacterium]|nr:UDP-N-acetylmuramoyl-L-alanine--D-glutamate ligase [Candidatus Acetothermia bacterium]